jgi:imidazolonepropionase-like amidohydrolase
VVNKAARMIDGTGKPPVRDAVVVVRGERIVATRPASKVRILDDAEILDRGDETLLPGFIDADAHLTIRPDVRALEGQLKGLRQPDRKQVRGRATCESQLFSGVTTVYVVGDMHFNDIHLQEAAERELIPGLRIVPAGEFINTTAGHGRRSPAGQTGPWEMRRAVRRNAEYGAHHVKLAVTGPSTRGPARYVTLRSGRIKF